MAVVLDWVLARLYTYSVCDTHIQYVASDYCAALLSATEHEKAVIYVNVLAVYMHSQWPVAVSDRYDRMNTMGLNGNDVTSHCSPNKAGLSDISGIKNSTVCSINVMKFYISYKSVNTQCRIIKVLSCNLDKSTFAGHFCYLCI